MSGLLRLVAPVDASSRRKLGPWVARGVEKFRGLGNVLLSPPVRLNQNGSKLLGLGRNSLFRNRDGRADAGVSMLMLLLGWGGGRANGFGGPVAPAESRADADGEGGGKTIPEACPSGRRTAACVVPASAWLRGDGTSEAAVAVPPPSDGSSGISSRRLGRDAPPPVLDRDGGGNLSGMDDTETFRGLLAVFSPPPAGFARGGEAVVAPLVLETAPTSTDWDRASALVAAASVLVAAAFFLAASAFDSALVAKDARCWDKIDRFSSIGVKMLCCLRVGLLIMLSVVRSNGCGGCSEFSRLISMGAGMDASLGCGCDSSRCGGGGRGER